MSQEVDNRIVQMRFDNAQFEKGVKQTTESLNGLKESLKLEDAAKGVEEVAVKFNALEIAATTAIAKIASKLTDIGINMAKSLSIDQITNGFSKYENELKAVKTIMNATGESIETVSSELSKLLWYTDETSYEYSNMVDNISKFTSQGIKLSDANREMQGIANLAGYVGASVGDAAHAMDGFAKAMAAGKMTLQNWRWIQTAHMETMQSKQAFIDAAVALGIFEKQADGSAKATDGLVVSTQNFTETLKEGWLTSEVMEKTFSDMASYSDLLYEFVNTYNTFGATMNRDSITTSDAMEILDDTQNRLAKSEEDLTLKTNAYRIAVKRVRNETLSYEEACEELANITDSLSKKGYEAGQQYRTFGDAIEATKDAVSSGWKEIFGYLFGNADEATELWSFVGDTLYTLFAENLEPIRAMLKVWHNDLEGFKSILRIVEAALGGILDIVEPLRNAIGDVFPTATAQEFLKTTNKIANFFESIRLSEEAMAGLTEAFKIILIPVKYFAKILTTVMKGVILLAAAVKVLMEHLLRLVPTADSVNDALSKVFGSAGQNVIAGLIQGLLSGAGKLVETMASIGTVMIETLKDILGIHSPSEVMFEIAKFCVEGFFNGITYAFGKIYKLATYIKNCIVTLFSDIDIGKILFRTFASAFAASVDMLLLSTAKLERNLGSFVKNIGKAAKKLASSIKIVAKGFRAALKNLSKAKKYQAIGDMLKGLAVAILAFAASLIVLSVVPFDKLEQGAKALAQLAALLVATVGALAIISKLKDAGNNVVQITTIFDVMNNAVKKLSKSAFVASLGLLATSLGIGMLSLAASIKIIGGMKPEEIEQASDVVFCYGAFIAIMAAFLISSEKMGLQANVAKFGTMMYKLAASLMVFAGAIKVFAKLSGDEYDKAKEEITSFLIFFSMVSVLLSAFSSSESSIGQLGSLFLKMGTAIALLVVPLVAISEIEKHGGNIAAGTSFISSVGTMFMAFTAICALAGDNFSEKLNEFSKAMLLFAVAIDLMTIPVMMFANMNRDQMTNASMMLVIVMGLFQAFLVLTTFFTSFAKDINVYIKVAAALAILTGCIVALALTLDVIKDMDAKTALAQAAILTGVIVALTGCLVALEKWGGSNIVKNAASVAIVVGCIVALGGLLWHLQMMDAKTALAQAAILTGIIAVISLCLMGLGQWGDHAVLSAAAITIVTACMIAIAATLKVLEDMDLTHAALMAVILSGVIVTISFALSMLQTFATEAVVAAAGIAIVTACMAGIAGLLYMMKNMDLKTAAIDAAILVGVVGVIAVAIGLLSSVAPMAALAAVAIGIVVASFWLLVKALQGLAAIDAQGANNIIYLFKSFLEMSDGLAAFAVSLVALATAATSVGLSLIVLAAGILALAGSVSVFSSSAKDLSVSAMWLATSVLMLGENIATAIRLVDDAFRNSSIGMAIKSGVELVSGLIDGMDGGLAAVFKSGAELGAAAIEGLRSKKGLDEHSPSIPGFESGEQLDVGVAKGIETGQSEVKKSAFETGKLAVDQVNDGIETGSKDSAKTAKKAAEKPVNALVDAYEKGKKLVGEKAKRIGSAATDGITTSLEGITDTVSEYLSFDDIDWANIGAVLKNGGTGALDAIKQLFSLKGTDLINGCNILGIDMGDGLIAGLRSRYPDLVDEIESVYNSITGGGNSAKTLSYYTSGAYKAAEATDSWDDILKDLNTDLTTTGGSTKSAAKSMTELAQEYKFGTSTIEKFKSAYKNVMIGTEEDMTKYSTIAIENLALELYKLSDQFQEDLNDSDLTSEDILSHIKDSFEEVYNGIGESIKSIDIFSDWDDGVDESAKSVNELALTYHYGEKAITDFTSKYGDAMKSLESTVNVTDIAEKSIDTLAMRLYQMSDAYEDDLYDAELTTEDVLAHIQDSYESMLENIESSITSIDIWGKFSKQTKYSAKTLIEDATKWTESIKTYQENLTKVMGSDISDSLKQNLASLGYNGANYIAAFANATEEELKEMDALWATFETAPEEASSSAMSAWSASLTGLDKLVSDGATDITASFNESYKNGLDTSAGMEEAEQLASNTIETIRDTLVKGVSSIKSSVKAAIAAEEDDDITADSILGNMTQWNTAIEEYKENLVSVANMGYSDNVKTYLANLGFEGREYIAALAEADEDMVEEINNAYAEFTTAQTDVGDEFLSSWAGVMTGVADLTTPGATLSGQNFALGFQNGLDTNAGVAKAQQMAINTLSAMNEALGIHSPSEKAREIGVYFCLGLEQGLSSHSHLIYSICQGIAQNAITGFKSILYTQASEVRSAAYYVGSQIDAGIAAGISDGSSRVYSAIRRVVRNAIEAAEDEADINSPSKVFAWMGKMMDMGLAQGITDNAQMAEESVRSSFTSIISSLYDYLDSNIDNSFVITPILDLSEIQNGVGQISSMFDAQKMDVNGQNGERMGTGSSYQFIQNNYSPKSLSRIDIYRQTKSQFSMLKGVNQ